MEEGADDEEADAAAVTGAALDEEDDEADACVESAATDGESEAAGGEPSGLCWSPLSPKYARCSM